MKLIFKDCIVKGVSPRKNGEMVFKIMIKAEDFNLQDETTLKALWNTEEGIDVEISLGEATTKPTQEFRNYLNQNYQQLDTEPSQQLETPPTL